VTIVLYLLYYGVENWKNNVVLKCLEIWQLSGKCRKTDQKSEKCCDRKIDGKSFVMESCLLLASRLELCQCLVTPFVHVRYTVEYVTWVITTLVGVPQGIRNVGAFHSAW